MDPNPTSAAATASTSTDDADDWDTEGFEVPSILTGNFDADADADAGTNPPISISAASANLTNPEDNKIEEKFHRKQQEPSSSTGIDTSTSNNAGTGASRKKNLKQKLREADKKFVGKMSGRENRIESLMEIMGGGDQTKNGDAALKESSRDWLDPHCHESQFDRRSH